MRDYNLGLNFVTFMDRSVPRPKLSVFAGFGSQEGGRKILYVAPCFVLDNTSLVVSSGIYLPKCPLMADGSKVVIFVADDFECHVYHRCNDRFITRDAQEALDAGVTFDYHDLSELDMSQ